MQPRDQTVPALMVLCGASCEMFNELMHIFEITTSQTQLSHRADGVVDNVQREPGVSGGSRGNMPTTVVLPLNVVRMQP